MAQQEALGAVEGADAVFSEQWKAFVRGELEASNERDSRNLGGRPSNPTEEEDETNQFEVNMDNIMKRFKCFNVLAQNSASEDDDKEMEDETVGNEPEGESETASDSAPSADAKIEVVLPDVQKMDPTYADTGFWKIDHGEDDIDELLADYD